MRLKCNLIKSDFQRIRNFFLFLSIFGEVVLFCKKGKLTTRYKIEKFSIFEEKLLLGLKGL